MSQNITRRRALSAIAAVLTGMWAVAVAAVTGLFVTTPWRRKRDAEETLLGRVGVYGPDFRAVRMRVPVEDGWYRHIEHKIVYVRVEEDGSPMVLAGACSHLSCTVNWNADDHEFVCPCHGGRFGEDGGVISGPPPTGLTRLPTEVREGDIYIRFSA